MQPEMLYNYMVLHRELEDGARRQRLARQVRDARRADRRAAASLRRRPWRRGRPVSEPAVSTAT